MEHSSRSLQVAPPQLLSPPRPAAIITINHYHRHDQARPTTTTNYHDQRPRPPTTPTIYSPHSTSTSSQPTTNHTIQRPYATNTASLSSTRVIPIMNSSFYIHCRDEKDGTMFAEKERCVNLYYRADFVTKVNH